MNTRQKNVSVTPTRNMPSRSVRDSEKENCGSGIVSISSGKKVEDLINGMRISACKTITNVKSSFGGFSTRLRQSTRKNSKLFKAQNYEELNEQVTPVKLYTPFSFVTPSPAKKVTPRCKRLSPKSPALKATPRNKRLSPKGFSFASPTGRFQKDVKQLSEDIKELEKIEKSLSLRKFR